MDPNTLERRCPRLGGQINFSYCLTCGNQKGPCFKIFDCWWESFDVVEYLKKRLSTEQFTELAGGRPIPKMTSLLEIIEQARQNIKSSKK